MLYVVSRNGLRPGLPPILPERDVAAVRLNEKPWLPPGAFSLIGISPTSPTRPFDVIRYAASRASSRFAPRAGVNDPDFVEQCVGLEHPLVAVVPGVVVRTIDDPDAHRLHVGGRRFRRKQAAKRDR